MNVTDEILAYVIANRLQTTKQIAKALGKEESEISGTLSRLHKAKMIRAESIYTEVSKLNYKPRLHYFVGYCK